MFTPKASLRDSILIKGVFPEATGQFAVRKTTQTCQPTDQARNALNDLLTSQYNRAWFEPGQDLALPFLPEVEGEGSCGEGEGKAEKDSIDQESDVRGVLRFEPGRYKLLQAGQVG